MKTVGIIGVNHLNIYKEIIEGLSDTKQRGIIIVSADIPSPPTLPEPMPIIPYREFDYNPRLTRKERRKLKRKRDK